MWPSNRNIRWPHGKEAAGIYQDIFVRPSGEPRIVTNVRPPYTGEYVKMSDFSWCPNLDATLYISQIELHS